MKRYLVWKDGKHNGKETEWVEITGKEFYGIVKSPEIKDRRFIHVHDFYDKDVDEWYYEATKEDYMKWRRFEMQEYRTFLEKLMNPIEWVSLDTVLYTDDNGDPVTLADTIPDEEADPMIEELLEAVEKLPSDEKAIIDLYYLDNFEKRSQREIADEIGVSQQVFSYRLKQILKKMKGLFCEK